MTTARILLVFTWIHAGSSIPVQSEVRNVTVPLGENATLNEPVQKEGYLKYKDRVIAHVNNGVLEDSVPEKFKGRVSWDPKTGFFSILNFNFTDSGYYSVERKGTNATNTEFFMTVKETPTTLVRPAVVTVVIIVFAVAAVTAIALCCGVSTVLGASQMNTS